MKASDPENLHQAPLDGAARGGYTLLNRRPRRPARNRWLAGFPFNVTFQLRDALLLLALGLLAGCAPSNSSAAPTEATAAATTSPRTTTPQLTTTAAPSISPPPLETVPAPRSTRTAGVTCGENARVETDALQADPLPRELPYHVVLPPCYSARPGLEYPTLFLLHGLAGDYDQWLSFGVPETGTRLMNAGEINPFLIVLPWHRTGIELESALVEELIPHIKANYRARRDGHWRAVGGISRGAGWAFRIGFKYPDHFNAVGLHSPALMGGDLFAAERWLEDHPTAQPPEVWVDIGDRDPLLEAVPELLERLEELGVEYEYQQGSGWHDSDYWTTYSEDYLRWYGSHW
ncbi:MAG: alpha/beta hydrolase-fold protein [Anaerolineales bacterium]|nr:alpha/beta hydrolase-fold protein [Anaerolineales bacterium]